MKNACKSLLDPLFVYRNAANTDVRLTFERVRREQAVLQRAAADVVVAVIGAPLAPAADPLRLSDGNTKAVNALHRLAKVT